MSKIPKTLRAELSTDPYYTRCARFETLHDHVCQPSPITGKLIEWEHALTYAGKQVQLKYAIVPLCWFVHSGPALRKEINVWIALNRATERELLDLSHKGAVDYFLKKSYLNKKFGAVDKSVDNPVETLGIRYGNRVEKYSEY